MRAIAIRRADRTIATYRHGGDARETGHERFEQTSPAPSSSN
jgi:hypothetical protein